MCALSKRLCGFVSARVSVLSTGPCMLMLQMLLILLVVAVFFNASRPLCLSRSHGRFAASLVVRDLGNASKILCLDGANHRLQERLCVGLRGARRHQRNDDALNARGLRVKEGSIDWSSICRRTEDASSEQSNPRVCVLSRALWGLRGSGGQGQQAGNGGLEGPRRGFEALVGAVGSHRATARAHPIARSVGNALSVGALCGCALCALCACALRALCGVCVRPIQEPRL